MNSTVRVIDRTGDDAELHVTDARWSVLTDDDDQPGAVCLRVVSHGEDIEDTSAGLRLLFVVEEVAALVDQMRAEVLPYYVSLVKGDDNGD